MKFKVFVMKDIYDYQIIKHPNRTDNPIDIGLVNMKLGNHNVVKLDNNE
jgi:hypothetical protein